MSGAQERERERERETHLE